MPRIVEINKGMFRLTEKKIEGFLERVVNPIGTSAKVDVPKRYIGRRSYVVIVKD